MNGRTRIVVVGGGPNCEHDVSLASAASVASALDPDRYAVEPLTIGRDGRWRDADGKLLRGGMPGAVARIQAADVVFPAVHGPRGEDGTLAALCDLAGVPYVGCGVRAGALAMDKHSTKLIAESVGVRTARGTVLTSPAAAPPFDLPAIVKPAAAGSSYGVSRVETPVEFDAAVAAALQLDRRALVETVVVGREIDAAVLERPDGALVVGPPLEIVLRGRAIFDTASKYDGTAEFCVPAPLPAADLASLKDAALALFSALGCAGLARFDFFLTSDGPVLNEVNTMPGMTEHSQLPKMFAASGLTYPQLLDVLIATAIARRART